MTRPFRIAIDFDGTIVEDEYPRIGSLKKDAVVSINLLKKLGCHIIISSCRTNPRINLNIDECRKQKRLMKKFLTENGIPFDEVDDGTQGKVVADVYICDHAIRFENNWSEIVRIVNLMKEEE